MADSPSSSDGEAASPASRGPPSRTATAGQIGGTRRKRDGGEDVPLAELSVAQMETRLRGAVTDLVHPSIQRMTILSDEVETLKGLVHKHAKDLGNLQLGQLKAQEQVGTVAQFKEELLRWDIQRRTAEAAVDEKLEAMLQKVDAQRFSLEQKESALHLMHRNLDRVASEVNRLLEDQGTVREMCESRIDDASRRLAELAADVEVRLARVDQRHNALSDELWGDELGLAKMAGELKKTNATFGKLEDAVASLQEGKAEAVQLDKLRSEVAVMVHEANTSTSLMRQTVGEVVNEVREHFRTASQTIASHNANFVKQVREEYQEELSNSAQLRDEVSDFMTRTTDSVDGLEQRVDEVASKANALAAEAREELEELNRRRKRDKTSADNELKQLKKRLGGVFDNSDAIVRGIEHIYSVLRPILESELMQCALEKQDSKDRSMISLMGVKDDETILSRTTQTEPQKPRPECRVRSAPGGPKPSKTEGSQSARGPGGGFGARQQPVVRVDNRCVSCSGQAPLVLAAFKMACLHYAPSAVEHQGSLCERQDLLDRRQQLLHQAHASLEGVSRQQSAKGPPGGYSAPTTAPWSAASGGASSGDQDRGDGFSEYASIEARYGSRASSAPGPPGAGLRLPDLQTSAMPPPVVSVK